MIFMLSYQNKTYRRDKSRHACIAFGLVVIATLFSTTAGASEARDLVIGPDLSDPRAIFCVIIFILSYLFVMTEKQKGDGGIKK